MSETGPPFPVAWSVVVLTGTLGAGKSSTLQALSGLAAAEGRRHVALDLDEIRLLFPRPDGDPYARRLGLANLAAIVPNVRGEGADLLLLADVVEHPDELRRYAEVCPGAAVTVVRQHVEVTELHRRLRSRESEAAVGWFLERAEQLQRTMAETAVGDLVVDVRGRDPVEVGSQIWTWLSERPV